MSECATRPSIRRRMLVFLVSSLVLMVAGATRRAYWVALRSANDAYDRSLLDPALDIAENLRIDADGAHVDLPVKALEALVYDQVDRVIFQVRSPTNAIVEGVADLPPPPELGPGQQIFFDGMNDGQNIRIAAHRTAERLRRAGRRNAVQAQSPDRRNPLRGARPTLLVAVAATALAWLGVAHGLQPLEELRLELMRRAPRDLRPLSSTAAPVEIAPVVEAFNDLLSQVRDASTMQERFLANAAHQLRTPLAGLQMHLELLLRRELSPDVRGEVERMHGATVRASRLANQLLALARAESAPEHGRELELVDLRAIAGAPRANGRPKRTRWASTSDSASNVPKSWAIQCC